MFQHSLKPGGCIRQPDNYYHFGVKQITLIGRLST